VLLTTPSMLSILLDGFSQMEQVSIPLSVQWMAAHQAVFGPTQSGTTDSDYEVREGGMPTVSTPLIGGDGGNVGIIRSPLRATVLPDRGGRQRWSSLPRQPTHHQKGNTLEDAGWLW
jgi:hypothetical protein